MFSVVKVGVTASDAALTVLLKKNGSVWARDCWTPVTFGRLYPLSPALSPGYREEGVKGSPAV